jgi:hypothetical protein
LVPQGVAVALEMGGDDVGDTAAGSEAFGAVGGTALCSPPHAKRHRERTSHGDRMSASVHE